MRSLTRLITICLALVAALLLSPTPAMAQDGQDEPAASGAHAPESHAPDAHAEGDSHAEGGHEKGGVIPSVKQGLAPLITALVVFGIVFLILSTKVWPKIASGLAERESKIREEIAAAEAARKQAKDALQQYEQSLAEARAEAQKMLEETRAQQGKLAAELKAKADAEVGQLRDRAMRDIEAARRAALNELYAESANLAVAVAGKILQREVTPADQKRLVDEALGEMQGAGR